MNIRMVAIITPIILYVLTMSDAVGQQDSSSTSRLPGQDTYDDAINKFNQYKKDHLAAGLIDSLQGMVAFKYQNIGYLGLPKNAAFSTDLDSCISDIKLELTTEITLARAANAARGIRISQNNTGGIQMFTPENRLVSRDLQNALLAGEKIKAISALMATGINSIELKPIDDLQPAEWAAVDINKMTTHLAALSAQQPSP